MATITRRKLSAKKITVEIPREVALYALLHMSEKTSSRITTDHKEIKEWVERRGGKPARAKEAGDNGDGILRIDFIEGDQPEESLEPLSWEDFFKTFEEKRLAFLYEQDEKSRFAKLIKRD